MAAGVAKNSLFAKHRGGYAPGQVVEADEAESGGFLKGIVDKLTTTE